MTAYAVAAPTAFDRTDRSMLGRWWWTVDKWTLAALLLLIACGAVMILAAGPAAAGRIRAGSFHFVQNQALFIGLGVLLLLVTSMLEAQWARRIAILALPLALMLTVATLFFGPEIKGAKRWLQLPGFSLQPSEFLKPCFAVFAAWLIAHAKLDKGVPGRLIATAVAALLIVVLLRQPDVGMAAVIFAIWAALMFVSGLSYFLVAGIVGAVAGLGAIAYRYIPHFQRRLDLFLDPSSGDTYQIDRSMDAFLRGGLWGRGPGEGTVKTQLPDAHSDFIFAVAGEEFGLVLCLALILIYAFVVLRGLARAAGGTSLFVVYATVGLLTAFGLQAFINMATALHLIPTKGMTLPFVSYGGSSFLALSFGMGLVLALTRKPGGNAA